MIDRVLRSVFIPYKSKLLSKIRSIKKIPQKFAYSLTAYIKKALKTKPSSKKDYFKIRKHFVLKKVTILLLCLFLVLFVSALKIYKNLQKESLPVLSASDKNNFSGKGLIYYESGNLKYEGSFKDGLFSGEGSLYYEDGPLYYKGNFDRNDFSGKGQTFYKNGNTEYEGDFLNGEYNGLGKLYNEKSVLIYQGNFVNRCYDGQGKLYDNEGNLSYEGKFCNNEFNGQGKLFNKGGSAIYQGDFQNGVYSGKGILYDANSNKVYEGSFENGKYSGAGVESYPSQSIKYTGNFLNGCYDGSGTLYEQDGSKIYEGTFKEGLYSQTGKLYDTSEKLIYEGEFSIGQPDGLGTVYADNENVVFKGYFRNGKIFYPGFLGLSQDDLKAILGNPSQIIVSSDSSMTIDYAAYKIKFFLDNIETVEQPPQDTQQINQAAPEQQPEQASSPQPEQSSQAIELKTFNVARIRLYGDPEALPEKNLIPDDYGELSNEKNVVIAGIKMSLKEYFKDECIFSFCYYRKNNKLNYLEVSKQAGLN